MGCGQKTDYEHFKNPRNDYQDPHNLNAPNGKGIIKNLM